MTCPRCQQPVTLEHLKQNPECAKVAGTLSGLFRLSQRKTVTHAGGRPAEMVPCPRCEAQVTRTQASRGHGCQRGAGVGAGVGAGRAAAVADKQGESVADVVDASDGDVVDADALEDNTK